MIIVCIPAQCVREITSADVTLMRIVRYDLSQHHMIDNVNQAGDQCNTEDNTCQPIPNECETDADCNVGDVSGVCTAAVAEQTQCFYCDASGLYNVCKPGCLHDADSTDVPRCPVSEPICDTETHFCNANPGATLLDKIVFTSSGCEGCSKEGVNMTLTGSDNLIDPPKCRTVDLDHPNQVDYVSRGEFNAQPAEQDMGWDSCYQVSAGHAGKYFSISLENYFDSHDCSVVWRERLLTQW